jgi:hypothetical protein
MATCAVTGNIIDVAGVAISSVTILARVAQPEISGTSLVTPLQLSVQTDTSGNFTMTIQQSLSVIFTIMYPSIGTDPKRVFNYTGNIPATTTANFTSVIVQEV